MTRRWANAGTQRAWLGAPAPVVRTATPMRALRLTWHDGTWVIVSFSDKGKGKSQVAVSHERLPNARAVARYKKFWKEALGAAGARPRTSNGNPGVIMRAVVSTLILAACAIAPLSAGAQSAPDDVLKTVRQLFDGMRKGDSAMVRAVFHPDAALLRPVERDGQVTLQRVPIDNFIKAIGTPHPEVWDEKVWNEKVFVDDRLATAWMDYAFFLGDKLSHCGVDSFQFAKMADGWKIIALADTQRRAGCKAPN